MEMVNNKKRLAEIAASARDYITTECGVLAEATGQNLDSLISDVLTTMRRVNKATSVLSTEKSKRDGRETLYKIRVQLLYEGGLVADTHDSLPINEPGDWDVSGLINVAKLAERIAREYHFSQGQVVDWLPDAETERRSRTIRVTLSRGQGRGRWRMPYHIGNEQWMAFVLLCTEEGYANHQYMVESGAASTSYGD